MKRKIWTNGYGELSTETRSGIPVQIAYGLGYSMKSVKFTRAEMRESICYGAVCRARRKDGWQIPKHIAAAIRRQEGARWTQRLVELDEHHATKQ